MKILSIAVPCYNSQEYMRKCVDSLLKGGEDVEILIVDDGSKDDTLKIARDYEEKYPTMMHLYRYSYMESDPIFVKLYVSIVLLFSCLALLNIFILIIFSYPL